MFITNDELDEFTSFVFLTKVHQVLSRSQL
jgi:hypothetical protein